jgi:hypothetical protein
MDKVKSKINEMFNNTTNKITGGDPTIQIIAVIVVSFIVMILIEIISKTVNRINNYYEGSPILVETIKSAKKRLVIRQYSNKKIDTLLRRSKNEWGGIEFTYRLWFYIDDWTYKYGSWKHIFHKGNSNSWPNRAPGAWLHPKKNMMRVYMNTYENIVDSIDIPNIPIHKWIHLTVMCKDRKINIYINGQLRKQLKLSGIPRQNYGDLYINNFGGFSGYISKMVYNDFALPISELKNIISEGPSTAPIPSLTTKPPYLATNWWQLNY